jgi:hypothetical protein
VSDRSRQPCTLCVFVVDMNRVKVAHGGGKSGHVLLRDQVPSTSAEVLSSMGMKLIKSKFH